MTAEDAVRTLAALEGYEETLTAKAFGITMMAFGIAGGATAMTYAHSADRIAEAGYGWVLSFLWMPWIFAAALLTATVWKTHAVTLRTKKEERGSWWWFLLFSAAYMALLAGVWWLDTRGALGLGEAYQNQLTLGLFTIAMALFFRWRFGASWMYRALYLVAGLLILLAFGYSALGLPEMGDTFLGAFTGVAVWVGAGAYIAFRG